MNLWWTHWSVTRNQSHLSGHMRLWSKYHISEKTGLIYNPMNPPVHWQRERQRERKTDRQTARERQTDSKRETDRQTAGSEFHPQIWNTSAHFATSHHIPTRFSLFPPTNRSKQSTCVKMAFRFHWFIKHSYVLQWLFYKVPPTTTLAGMMRQMFEQKKQLIAQSFQLSIETKAI